MDFNQTLQSAILIKRYKRFLADVTLDNGEDVTIYCPNTGSMQGCAIPGSRVWYSENSNSKRKYSKTWELVQLEDGAIIGIHSSKANDIIDEALIAGRIAELSQYQTISREVTFKGAASRLDFKLDNDIATCYVEVKSVTLADDGIGYFPDAVSTRGQKHLRHLIEIVQDGHQAVLLFCVQHSQIREVRPADHIDPAYGELCREALEAGVKILAYGCSLSPRGIKIDSSMPVLV